MLILGAPGQINFADRWHPLSVIGQWFVDAGSKQKMVDLGYLAD